ncbi:hypothetical protein HHK36_004699 [Tetracentron sinense]|uniref:CCT domain-containing protein n=1 Tax=Tetracentron sinense TaxID=13715 RepID=A0A834ZSI8_TETSI|nr:hypothetical protein HHK36_004699 [Tetracentron sinense]
MASSVSEFISDYSFPTDFCEIPPSFTASAMWGEISFPFSETESMNIMQPETGTESSVSGASFPERLGLSTLDMADSTLLPDFDTAFCGIVDGIQSYGAGIYPQDLYEFGEKRNGFASDFRPSHASGDFWYACRKTLADRRVRVRGRFARNSELSEEAMAMKNNNNRHEEEELYYDGDAQIKQNEEDWLQESVASLMYFPYIS